MDTILHNPLTSIDASLTKLVTSLQTSPSFASAPGATQSLISADDELTSALSLLEYHQRNYARILRLRAEAAELEEKVRSIVRKADEFRKNLGAIAPGVLEDDSDEDEDAEGRHGTQSQDVSYDTLLNFARGIGKYNAEAAKEVEKQEQRLRVEAKKRAAGNTPNEAAAINGISTTTNGIKTNSQPSSTDVTGPEAAKQIMERAEGWLHQTSEQMRFAGTTAFPSSDRLRLGLLARLQAIREESSETSREGNKDQVGEEAVEKEIEKMIAVAEGKEIIEGKDDYDEIDTQMTGIAGHGGMDRNTGQQRDIKRAQQAQSQQQQPQKKALNLDLWDESDED